MSSEYNLERNEPTIECDTVNDVPADEVAVTEESAAIEEVKEVASTEQATEAEEASCSCECEKASDSDADAAVDKTCCEKPDEKPIKLDTDEATVPVLKCVGLTKSYKKRVKVLDKLNLTIPQGKIVGLLGPNGCGKSTLMKLVTGILSPDSGVIEICGEERSAKTNSYISYLPERTYFNSWMKVDSLIKYFVDFYEDFDEEIARKMFSDLGIDTKAKLRTLSKGTKEKVQLVMVMARRAKLYLLDEPIAGVDPAARDYILRTIIGNYNPEATIIITTHLIYDIEPALDEFCFMAPGGKIVLSGVCDDVRAEYGRSLDQIFKEVFRC